MQQAYDVAALAQIAGGNQTIAIVDAYDSPTAESDLATYRSTFNLPLHDSEAVFRRSTVGSRPAARHQRRPERSWQTGDRA